MKSTLLLLLPLVVAATSVAAVLALGHPISTRAGFGVWVCVWLTGGLFCCAINYIAASHLQRKLPVASILTSMGLLTFVLTTVFMPRTDVIDSSIPYRTKSPRPTVMPNEWVAFAPKKAPFRVEIPKGLTMTPVIKRASGYSQTVGKFGSYLFAVHYRGRSEKRPKVEMGQRHFDYVQRDVTGVSLIDVIKRIPGKVGEHPCLEYHAKSDLFESYFASRVIITDKAVFAFVLSIAENQRPQQSIIRRFLDSCEILEMEKR